MKAVRNKKDINEREGDANRWFGWKWETAALEEKGNLEQILRDRQWASQQKDPIEKIRP